jgi:phosphoribosyl 1,2-cyclic phosphate phosphodiesterase
MKATLLGTASAEGMPGLFCRCASCDRARAAGGKNIRTRSSALIDGVLKIDFPPDTLAQVVRNGIDLSQIEAVLFTHGHDDHFSPSELQYRGRYFVTTPLTRPLDVYGPADVIDRLRCLLDPDLIAFNLHVVEPERSVDVGGYEAFPFLANHDDSITCLNYILKGPDGASLLYATDTGWYPERTWRMLEQHHFDGAVVECTKRDESGYPGHLSIPELIRMRRRLEAAGSLAPSALMMATHFGHQMELLHDELEAALAPHGIHAAYDGVELDIVPTSLPRHAVTHQAPVPAAEAS